jgi:hypothetical protein
LSGRFRTDEWSAGRRKPGISAVAEPVLSGFCAITQAVIALEEFAILQGSGHIAYQSRLKPVAPVTNTCITTYPY